MEYEDILSPQTPRFGIPSNNVNFSEMVEMELAHKLNPNEKEEKRDKKVKKEKREKREKSKNKHKKHSSEKLFPSKLSLDKENPYYELLAKKITLRNDFDRKNVKKFLSEIEEGFEGCDLDDEISENDS